MSTQVTNPAPMPLVMLNVSGMMMSVRRAGSPTSTSPKSMSLSIVAIR